MIFVNLPVKDLNRSIEFYTKLGYSQNLDFSNEQGACIVISETIFVMLLTEDFYQTFTNKPIANTSQTSAVINCLSANSRDHVDELLNNAFSAGATKPKEMMEMPGMYGGSFYDPDGHHWEVMYMEPYAVAGQEKPAEVAQA